jgi:ribosome-associated translation inhibitor RaiA
MATHVTGKTLDVGEALRSYVQKRVVHTGEKFLARARAGRVRIEKEHGDFRTNCTIDCGKEAASAH